MTASRSGVVALLALAAQGCTTGAVWSRRHSLAPPAMEDRPGAPERSAGPDSEMAGGGGRGASTARATGNSTPTSIATGNSTPTSIATGTPTSSAISTATPTNLAAALGAVSSLVGRRTVVLDGVD